MNSGMAEASRCGAFRPSLVTDPAIPQLKRLTRPTEAVSLLNSVLEFAACGFGIAEGPLAVHDVAVLRGHPGSRWTLRYAVESRVGAASTIFAKVYARDRRDIAGVLSALSCSGLGLGQPMQAVAPIAYSAHLRLLLLKEAPGESARAALRRGSAGIGERSARWLASFHTAAPLPPAYRLHDPLSKAQRWTQSLTKSAALCRDARRLLAALAAAQQNWPPARPRMVHGDFGASHVYLAGGVVTVIDWDSWTVGDYGEDAGRFMASLHNLAASDSSRAEAVMQERDIFADTYRTAVPAARNGLPFYEAFACLRKAARLSSTGGSRHLRRAELLLAAGERALGRR
jgi:Phosphotransferase enzyme family